MNILLVTHYYYPHIGGIEVVAYNQAKELVKKGHKVTIITSSIKDEKAISTHVGIRVIRIKAVNFLETKYNIPYPIFSPKLLWVLREEVKRSDLIHAHGAIYLASLISSLFSKIYNKPFIVTEHVGFVSYKNALVNSIQKVAFATIGRITLNSCKKIFVVNKRIKKFLSHLTKTKIEYLANGVDINLFRPVNQKQKAALRKKYDLPFKRKLVLFVGRFVQKKGVDLLIKAITSDFDFVFVGEGRLPKNAYCHKGIFVRKPMSQRKLAEIYGACDIFVLPSKGEGFPLVIQEAMASGLPIITGKDNLRADHRNPELVSTIRLSVRDIQKSIRGLLKNPPLMSSMSKKVRKVALAEFSWSYQADLLIQTYQAISNHE